MIVYIVYVYNSIFDSQDCEIFSTYEKAAQFAKMQNIEDYKNAPVEYVLDSVN